VEHPRTYLFAPAHDGDRVTAALRSSADVVIFDLEDSVPPEMKVAARDALPGLLDAAAGRRVHVRINRSDNGYVGDELRAAVRSGVEALRLPKVDDVTEVVALITELDELERAGGVDVGSMQLFLTIESARGMFAARDLAAAARTRGGRLVFGAGDLRMDLGFGRRIEDGEPTLLSRSWLVLASAAAGVGPPCDGFSSEPAGEALVAATKWGASLGFVGKSVASEADVQAVHTAYADLFTLAVSNPRNKREKDTWLDQT